MTTPVPPSDDVALAEQVETCFEGLKYTFKGIDAKGSGELMDQLGDKLMEYGINSNTQEGLDLLSCCCRLSTMLNHNLSVSMYASVKAQLNARQSGNSIGKLLNQVFNEIHKDSPHAPDCSCDKCMERWENE
jgi:hypothetical protein